MNIEIQITQSGKKVYTAPQMTTYGSVYSITQGGGSMGSETSNMEFNVMTQSDRVAKEDIVKVGIHPIGIGLYFFKYKHQYRDAWGHGRQFGVMADEVEKVMPEAVSVHPEGYKMVDYTMLGISRAVH